MLHDMFVQWIFIAVMTLLGLIVMRHWLTRPLSYLLELINTKSRAQLFYRVAKQCPGEFSDLAASIGGVLCRLEDTGDELMRR